jgi:uncharacterized protein
MLRWLVGVAAVSALAIVAYLLLLYTAQRSVLFPAPHAVGGESGLSLAGGQPVWLQLASGRSEAWFLPSLPPSRGAGPLVIFAHGNAELIDFWVGAFDTPRSWGVSILLVEYPGYGRSVGRPSETSITAAMVAAFDWAAGRADIDRRRIVAYGRSVGGGAACALARERPVAALVLESAFTSVRSMALRFGLPGFLVRDPFDNLSVVRSYSGPMLLVHGEHDDIVPARHARELQEAARSAELHLLSCGHNDCPRPWPELRRFLARNGIL